MMAAYFIMAQGPPDPPGDPGSGGGPVGGGADLSDGVAVLLLAVFVWAFIRYATVAKGKPAFKKYIFMKWHHPSRRMIKWLSKYKILTLNN